jgi:AcrR family transcriptional regulator
MYTNEPTVRERLLDGAIECLRKRGYAETTARDIAAASDANLRSIGYHFGSTKGLLVAAISLNFRRWLEPLIAIAADGLRSPDERLSAGILQFTDSLPDNAPVLRAWLEAIVLAGHEPELAEALADNQAEFRRRLTDTLSEAGATAPERQANALITLCDGLIVRYLLQGEIESPIDVGPNAAEALALASRD